MQPQKLRNPPSGRPAPAAARLTQHRVEAGTQGGARKRRQQRHARHDLGQALRRVNGRKRGMRAAARCAGLGMRWQASASLRRPCLNNQYACPLISCPLALTIF